MQLPDHTYSTTFKRCFSYNTTSQDLYDRTLFINSMQKNGQSGKW